MDDLDSILHGLPRPQSSDSDSDHVPADVHVAPAPANAEVGEDVVDAFFFFG